MSTMATVAGAARQELGASFGGELIGPDDPGYDEARAVYNAMIDRRPALVVRAADAGDVMATVDYARENQLDLAVRGGSHSVPGFGTCDDGVVIDLGRMRGVRVDAAKRTARAEGGATWGDFNHATHAFGLATTGGIISTTGIGGLTLGGGIGHLARGFGLSIDSLISADVVTADGRLVVASETENEDLFWALRGGGWDLGVVTSFEYRAQRIDPDVFFLFVAYPLDEAEGILAALNGFMATAPDGANPIAVLWTFPTHGDAYPPEVHGKQFIAIVGPYIGTAEEGERVCQPLRELGAPLLDGSGAIPYLAVQHSFDGEYPVGRRYYWKSVYLPGLPDEVIQILTAHGRQRPSPLSSIDVWPLGGAMARVPVDATPIAQRDAAYLIGIEANWDDPADDEANRGWARDVAAALAPYSTGASYLNFEDVIEAGTARATHGPNYDRLVATKRRYDPENRFRSRRSLVS
jgi:FAD/FMN-containing dehydrogenase